MVSKKRYSKKRNTQRRFKKLKGSKKRIRKYKGGKAIPPKIVGRESIIVSEEPVEPVEPIIIPEQVENLDEGFIEEDSDDDDENYDDNTNVFDDLNTYLKPQELGLEGGSKKSTLKKSYAKQKSKNKNKIKK
jgi:hypothetical protein